MIVTGVERPPAYHDALRRALAHPDEDTPRVLAEEFDVVLGPKAPLLTQHGCDARARELGMKKPRPCAACGRWRPDAQMYRCDWCRHAWFCDGCRKGEEHHIKECSCSFVDIHGGYGEYIDTYAVRRIVTVNINDLNKARMRLWDEHGIVHLVDNGENIRVMTELGCDRYYAEEGKWRVPPAQGQQFRPCRQCNVWERWVPGDAVRSNLKLCPGCSRVWMCGGRHDPDECRYFRVAALVHARRPKPLVRTFGTRIIVAGRAVCPRNGVELGFAREVAADVWFPHEPEGIRQAFYRLYRGESEPWVMRQFLDDFDIVGVTIDQGVQVVYTRESTPAVMCWNCGLWDADFHQCSGCARATYCSPKCQRARWKDHKVLCRAYEVD